MSFSFKSDVWALGTVFYEASQLKYAFEGQDVDSLHNKILYEIPESLPRCYSNSYQKLIMMMLDKNEVTRPNVKDIF